MKSASFLGVFPVVVLFLFLVEVHAGFAGLIDQAEFELVEVLGAERELARRVFAAFYFAVDGRCYFRFTWFLIAHGYFPFVKP